LIGSRLIPFIHSQNFQDFSPLNYFLQIFPAQSHSDKHLGRFYVVSAFIQQRNGSNYRVGKASVNQ